ncbi:MAG: protein-L-isoaspartate(D-aspartate) O-methyltransferase [Caldilineaceae bacterium]|nr:protein-L-isoaspartate(D-aspartate) O-methyltransferase [Caldilineaceae bacterium]
MNFPWADQWPEITDEAVRTAFAEVPRERFVPAQFQDEAHKDRALPIGENQTISQPLVVAVMTQASALRPDDRILEIGTGSGYQTAILCAVTAQGGRRPGANIYSMERLPSLSATARQALHASGYAPHLLLGDGAAGYPPAAPYNAIVVTAAPPCLPRALWEQLAEGGRMAIPIGPRDERQTLWLLTKARGRMAARSLGLVRFVPLLSPLLYDPARCMEIEA